MTTSEGYSYSEGTIMGSSTRQGHSSVLFGIRSPEADWSTPPPPRSGLMKARAWWAASTMAHVRDSGRGEGADHECPGCSACTDEAQRTDCSLPNNLPNNIPGHTKQPSPSPSLIGPSGTLVSQLRQGRLLHRDARVGSLCYGGTCQDQRRPRAMLLLA